MSQVVLLLGGNIGDRLKYLSRANSEIQKVFSIKKLSAVYKTAPWGTDSQQAYLNQAMVVDTDMPAQEVLEVILGIEQKLDRVREQKWGDRTMDIDLIYYEDLVIQSENLTIPHPLMQDRRFVLIPLVEILPDFVHPVFGKSTRKLLEECLDRSEVSQLDQ
ncbi:2-amino-4-hydroxy-6-hydroxymethyldihydropteridine diphosphokinase [Litoribacter ruber]|uniref:2-amino-4-hydroxy-6- hydroxymethyldihydropteridine diphosphokinase n=1 Tax=Litoribacter ruber TaxID=702568 RepID=UPI001BDAD177|nr:2-amino-4-hydroxy-6-hydroxymethyldihydropteridine diphosphokinase [Litoribacter ruber]MBT0810941.1 2-amino-4-hydroxy-6-hydroxymethyldihydropteridine diphosphokinase [Litoribacter ruber]